jgi:hypothetical protein
MTPKQTARLVLYGVWAVTNLFLFRTAGFTAATWDSLDWFQLLSLALALNSNVLLVVYACLDNSFVPNVPSPPVVPEK